MLTLEEAYGLVSSENPNAVATFSRDGIVLWMGSDRTDIYHEAWHGFSTLVLGDNKKKLYDSHGQGYSRRGDCLKVHNANFKDNAKMVDVTRAEFDRLFKPAPKKKVKKK